MATVYNEGYCFYCGAPTDDWDEVGRTRLYVCRDPECNRELRNEQRAYEDEVRERAREDDYDAYR